MKWWNIRDDGAPMKCDSCTLHPDQPVRHAGSMIMVEAPDGYRAVSCKEEVDKDWLAKAKYMGYV